MNHVDFKIKGLKIALRWIRKISAFSCILLTFALAACVHIGPKMFPGSRYGFNMAVGYSNDRELLLNIVRLRYDDTPSFLAVTSIYSNYYLSTSGGGTVSGTFTKNIPPVYNPSLNANVSLSESPSFTYTPLAGQDYATKLLTPLSLSNVYLILDSGWNIERVFRIAVQCIGKICNAPTASRPTSTLAPRLYDFFPLVNLLRDLQVNDELLLDFRPTKAAGQLRITLSPNRRLTPSQRQIFKKSGVEIYKNVITFTTTRPVGPHETYIKTRSLLEMLNYLSKGVMLSPADIKNQLAVVSRYPDGRPFDWLPLLNEIMRIHQMPGNRPRPATLAIQYRGRWFYIPDSDETSKKTIILLAIFSELLQSRPVGVAPIYSISSSRPGGG